MQVCLHTFLQFFAFMHNCVIVCMSAEDTCVFVSLSTYLVPSHATYVCPCDIVRRYG